MTDKKYQTILADPPWQQGLMGKWKRDPGCARDLPYPTMTVDEIKALPINDLAEVGCHLWLWTTNQFLRQGFDVMEAWGFKYLAPITWVKPSGCGNYFIHVTQTILFGYKERCIFPLTRYKPTVLIAPDPHKHSQKPEASYDLIESISPEPRLELFARRKRFSWDCWGNEVDSDVELINA
jgi:N6-adenosine-specific RNA methylase IME4